MMKYVFDRERNHKFYETYEDLCSCSSCRNFYKAIYDCSSELKNFLEQFGIIPDKPIEAVDLTFSGARERVYEVYYAV
ncbi:MAG: hypothetical protein ACI38A_06905, partial [Candidatus Ornithomonoglobus sp.]